jgi:hypothetical protein
MGAGRSSDFARSLLEVIRHKQRSARRAHREKQIMITKALLVHVSDEIPDPQAKTPFLAVHRDRLKIKQLSSLWRLSCDNFVNFRLACLFVSDPLCVHVVVFVMNILTRSRSNVDSGPLVLKISGLHPAPGTFRDC